MFLLLVLLKVSPSLSLDLLQTGEVGEEAVDVGEDGGQETCSSLRIFSSSGFC